MALEDFQGEIDGVMGTMQDIYGQIDDFLNNLPTKGSDVSYSSTFNFDEIFQGTVGGGELPPMDLPDPITYPFDKTFTEEAYVSEVLNELIAKFILDLQGGTGLNQNTIDAIIARETARDETILNESIARFTLDCQLLGVPSELITGGINMLRKRWEDGREDKLRATVVWVENQVIENLRFTAERTLDLLTKMLKYWSDMMNRKLRNAILMTTALIDYYVASLAFIEAQVVQYEAEVVMYAANAKGQAAKETINAEYAYAEADRVLADMKFSVDQAIADLNILRATAQAAMEVADGVAQGAAQIASASLATTTFGFRQTTDARVSGRAFYNYTEGTHNETEYIRRQTLNI